MIPLMSYYLQATMGVMLLLARPSFLAWKFLYRRGSHAGLADASAHRMKCRSSEYLQKHPWVPIAAVPVRRRWACGSPPATAGDPAFLPHPPRAPLHTGSGRCPWSGVMPQVTYDWWVFRCWEKCGLWDSSTAAGRCLPVAAVNRHLWLSSA